MLQDKVVIATGAGSGTGLATAVILAQAGAKVVASGRSRSNTEGAVKTIRDAGGTAVKATADESKEADVIAMVDCALSEFGRVTHVQFMEDTFGTAPTFRADGTATNRGDPDAGGLEA